VRNCSVPGQIVQKLRRTFLENYPSTITLRTPVALAKSSSVDDTAGSMWRLLVKTASGRSQANSIAFQYRIRESTIQTPQTPELHFIFVMRANDRWRFLIMDRAVLRNYVVNNNLGTPANDYRQIYITLHNDGRTICSGTTL
jgi:hypothetical protein